MTTSTSKTQARVLKLIGRNVPENYEDAARLLEDARLPSDGMPRGATWRSVAKMSDDELVAALRIKREPHFDHHNVHDCNY